MRFIWAIVRRQIQPVQIALSVTHRIMNQGGVEWIPRSAVAEYDPTKPKTVPREADMIVASILRLRKLMFWDPPRATLRANHGTPLQIITRNARPQARVRIFPQSTHSRSILFSFRLRRASFSVGAPRSEQENGRNHHADGDYRHCE